MSDITQSELKELLNYNKETGDFTWIKPDTEAKIGVAGCYCNGYVVISINGEAYYAHRLAWFYVYGVWPQIQIDHENHIKDDNRLINLQEATILDNQRNASKRKDNLSGVTGVSWTKAELAWKVQIRIDGERLYLGLFKDKFEAICARMSANNKYGFHPNHGRKINNA